MPSKIVRKPSEHLRIEFFRFLPAGMNSNQLQTFIARAINPKKGFDFEKFLHKFQQEVNAQKIARVPSTDLKKLFHDIWMVLLETAANPSSTVRLASQRAMNVFLTRVTPYDPALVLDSFTEVVRSADFDVNAMIVIASSFAYLSTSFVARHRLHVFVDSTPVFDYLKSSDSALSEHFVTIIGHLRHLGNAWLEKLLKHFLVKFESDNSRNVIKAIAAIVSHCPDVFLPEVMKCTKPETPGFLPLMSFLVGMNEGKLANIDLMPLAKQAVKALELVDTCPADLDSALQLLAMKSESFNVDVAHMGGKTFHIKVWNASESAQADFSAERVDSRPSFYLIKLPIEFLKPEESDSLLIRNAKFKSLAQNEDLNVIEVYRIFEPYLLDEYGDKTSGALQGLQYCVNRILNGVTAVKLNTSIRKALFAKTQSWFHALDILKIVKEINPRIFTEVMGSRCFRELLHVVIGFCFCENSSLSKESVQALGCLTTPYNFDQVTETVVEECEYFDARHLSQALSIFITILKRINKSTTALEIFAQRVIECVGYYVDELDVISKIFGFFRYYSWPVDALAELIEVATAICYCSISVVNGKAPSPFPELTKDMIKHMTETVTLDLSNRTADMITSPSGDYRDFLRPMRQALRFLFFFDNMDHTLIAINSFVLFPRECSLYFLKKWQFLSIESHKEIVNLFLRQLQFIGDEEVPGIWCQIVNEHPSSDFDSLRPALTEIAFYSLKHSRNAKLRNVYKTYLHSQHSLDMAEFGEIVDNAPLPDTSKEPDNTPTEMVVEGKDEEELPAKIADTHIQSLFEQYARHSQLSLLIAILAVAEERNVKLSISDISFPPVVVPIVAQYLGRVQPDIVTKQWALEHLRTSWRPLAIACIKTAPNEVLEQLLVESKMKKAIVLNVTSIIGVVEFDEKLLFRLASKLAFESTTRGRFQATLRMLAVVLARQDKLMPNFMSEFISSTENSFENLDGVSSSIIALTFARKVAPDKEFIEFVKKLLVVAGPKSSASSRLNQILIGVATSGILGGGFFMRLPDLIRSYIESVIPSRYHCGLKLLEQLHLSLLPERMIPISKPNLEVLINRFIHMSRYPFTAELHYRALMSAFTKQKVEPIHSFLFSFMPNHFELSNSHPAYALSIRFWPIVIKLIPQSSPLFSRISSVIERMLCCNQGFRIGMTCLREKLGKFPKESRFEVMMTSLRAWREKIDERIDYSLQIQVNEWINLGCELSEGEMSPVIEELMRVKYLLPVLRGMSGKAKKDVHFEKLLLEHLSSDQLDLLREIGKDEDGGSH